MEKPDYNQSPPQVTQVDILALAVQEITEDDSVRKWWQELATEDRLLARELIKRAYFDTVDENFSSAEVQRLIVDAVAYYAKVKRIARTRVEEEAAKAQPEIDGTVI